MTPNSLRYQLIQSLKRSAAHNRNLMEAPEVILWPDPERQWEAIIPTLQAELPQLLVLGDYNPEHRRGPVIWIKTLVAGQLKPVAGTPIVYLPGVSKQQLKRLGEASLEMQPLLEYVYTGSLWQHRNGKEWTVAAFLQNEEEGLGLNLAQDVATREAVLQCLPTLFEEAQLQFPHRQLNAPYFRSLLLPDLIPTLLSWLNEGEKFLRQLPPEKRAIFTTLCQEQFDLEPQEALRVEAACKLGEQHNRWRQAWEYFANSPTKYAQIQQLLRKAKPEAAQPEESWPQVNESAEDQLRQQLTGLTQQESPSIEQGLTQLEQVHGKRRTWVWAELGQAPLAQALASLHRLATLAAQRYPFGSLAELSHYYETQGYQVDQAARQALAAVDSGKDREVVSALVREVYLPWLETLTEKFQQVVAADSTGFTGGIAYRDQDTFVLFVDALRWELGREFAARLRAGGLEVEVQAGYCALPSLTPTAKVAVSPVADKVSHESEFKDFRPQSLAGKDLTTAHFRDLLTHNGYAYHELGQAIDPARKYWQAIGDIDSKGHSEGARMVKRVDELYEQVRESVQLAFEQGVQQVRIVTDHGWLLMPGGLPKATLTKDHADTRWGRCALIKEGAKSELLQLPWRWNPNLYLAYAPGVSFFKAHEEYAHGGVSLQECMVPTLVVHNPIAVAASAHIATVKWTHLRCKVEASGHTDGCEVDIRTKFSDPDSSVVLSAKRALVEGVCSLMVDDAAEEQAATVVLLNAAGVIIDKVHTTVGDN